MTPIYIRFSTDGRYIRKWSFTPFEKAVEYVPVEERWEWSPPSPIVPIQAAEDQSDSEVGHD